MQVRLESKLLQTGNFTFQFFKDQISTVQLTIIAVIFLYGILLKTVVSNAILYGNNILVHNQSSAQIDDASSICFNRQTVKENTAVTGRYYS